MIVSIHLLNARFDIHKKTKLSTPGLIDLALYYLCETVTPNSIK